MHDRDPQQGAPRPDHQCLFEAASAQGGYFTAGQAAACGFSRASVSYHTRRGRFLRVRRGLYRLVQFPASPREEVLAAWLAVGKDVAVVSHESALDLLGLSDVVPRRVNLTVPRSKRYLPSEPGVVIHTTTRPMAPNDVVTRYGLPVTAAARSIVDSAEAGTAPEQVVMAAREAVERGLVTRSLLTKAAIARRGRAERLIRRALEGVGAT